MDIVRPLRICHGWQVNLIETGSALEAFLEDIKDEQFAVRVQRERFPVYLEQYVAHAEKTTERKHCISNAAARYVQHDGFDFAQIFTSRVHNRIAGKRIRRHELGAGTGIVHISLAASNDASRAA